ncbi:hypothetical protein N5853_07510 [Bartonella sp. HY329]|uniref:hypothetical protein n=1 Tax=unclassified Bartonella TaxID=2645622 RepID=UPI0021C851C1|nr:MULTISPECIES: hypothetical protein [unclassified Bartonella]UXM93975.1 hypothetical protein N5853_07510 [Bartonella sp. HY329]UXN08296.1 hypothetical protein N5852_07520 [Bartonella sp. HY328]
MFRDNKIIIVDNEESELNRLASVIWKEGIACKALLYDTLYDTPLKGVRVAFFDVNLTSLIAPNSQVYDYNKDSSLRDIFANLAFAIQQYIANDNGPYTLIFWTKNQILINNFKVFMDDRGKDYSMPNPIYIGCIDKSQFLHKESTGDNTLYSTIHDIIKKSPVHLLYDLEKKANQAITNTINELHTITLDANSTWTNPIDNIKKTFIEIAKNTIGEKHVKEHFGEGIISGLNPMINFHMEELITLCEDTRDLFQVSDDEMTSNGFNDVEKKYELNTVFHINKNATRCERGAVYACNNDLQKKYIGDESDRLDWIKQLINFKDSTKDESEIQNIIKKIKFILVELSPACDYSQKKDRLLKFILGIKTPEIQRKLLSSSVPAYSYFPKTLFKDQDKVFQLIFNFNYTISLPRSNINEPIGDLLFSFKKEYMDMLTTKYANHISRIGVTEFK